MPRRYPVLVPPDSSEKPPLPTPEDQPSLIIRPGIDDIPLPTPFADSDTGQGLKTQPSGERTWYDGTGSTKKLRVKRLVDLTITPPERPTDAPDPGKVAEVHGQVQKALRDEDDRALGKLFEDILDSAHNSFSAPNEKTDPYAELNAACDEFEAALAAELTEFARQQKGWGAAYNISDDPAKAVIIRFRTPERHEYEWSCDMRALSNTLFEGKIPKFSKPKRREPRRAAVMLIEKAIKDVRVERVMGGAA